VRSDVNCSGGTDVGDVYFLINFLFAGGPAAPVACESSAPPSPGLRAAAPVSDTLTVGSASVDASATQVRVPVYVNDLPGTSLGSDQPAGYGVTQLWFEVSHGASCITNTSFDLTSGILNGLTVSEENSAFEPGGFKFGVDIAGAIPFTHGADPGDKVGDLVFTLNGCAPGVLPLTVTTAGSWAASLGCVNCVGPGLVESPAGTGNNRLSASGGKITFTMDNAQFIEKDVPTTMVRNHTYTIFFRMKNTGNTTWSYYHYALESQNPKDNTLFGPALQGSCDALAPGQTCMFTFNVTAPSTTGTYNIQRRMTHDGVSFGDFTPNVVVTVTNH
jgi:hypothetical protein